MSSHFAWMVSWLTRIKMIKASYIVRAMGIVMSLTESRFLVRLFSLNANQSVAQQAIVW